MGFLIFISVALLITGINWWIKKQKAEEELNVLITKKLKRHNFELIRIRDSEVSDGNHPFNMEQGFTPTFIINNKPGGKSYNYKIVEFKTNTGEEKSIWVEIVQKTLSNTQFNLSSEIENFIK